MLVSTTEGEALCLETTPEEVFWVWPEDGLLAPSNHFLCPIAKTKYKDLKVISSPDTLYRNRRVDGILRPKLGDIVVNDIKTALFDDFGYPRAVCRPPVADIAKKTKSMTVAMVIMDLTDRTMWVCTAPHQNKTFTQYAFSSK